MAEARIFGHVWLESLVLAILLGDRDTQCVGRRAHNGKAVSTSVPNFCLKWRVVLLGASLSVTALKLAGLDLLGGIVAVVIVAIMLSYGIGRYSVCTIAWPCSWPAAIRSAATRQLLQWPR